MVCKLGQRLRSRLGRVTATVILSAGFLTAVTCAEGLPEPPADSTVAVRLLPWPASSTNVDTTPMINHPLFRLLGVAGSELFGFEPLKFMERTFDGTVVAAILSKGGTQSGLKAFASDRSLRATWYKNTSELSSLAQDLDDYFLEEESYPEDLQTYLDEVRYYSPSLSSDVICDYQRLKGGKAYRLSLVFPRGSELAKLGKAPVFHSEQGASNLVPTARPVPLNLVVGTRIKDKKELVGLLDKAFGPAQGGFWQTPESEGLSMLMTVRGEWLVASDQLSNLGGFLKSLNGETPGWSKNKAFQKVARNLTSEAPFLLFLDTPTLVSALEAPTDGLPGRLTSLVGPMGYSMVPYTESQNRIEIFMAVNAPKGSELESFLAAGNQKTPPEDLATTNIPWDVSNMFALDYDNSKALVDSLVALFPEATPEYEMSQDVFAGFFGLDAEAGFDGLFSGPIVVSFERIDLVLNTIEAALTLKTSDYPEESGDTEFEDTESDDRQEQATPQEAVPETESDASVTDLKLSDDEVEAPPAAAVPKQMLARMPATFAFQVPLSTNRERLISLLAPYLGEAPSRETVYGVEVVTGTDGLLSYAIDGEWMYVSGGRTERLARHMLETTHGRRESLASVDSWVRFSTGSRGRLLGFGHQKVDWLYSLMKGFLLLLGSEFRPLATELGKLRDYHTIVTAIPEGLLIVGEIVQGEER